MSSGFLFNSNDATNNSIRPPYYDDQKYKGSEIYSPNRRSIETIYVSTDEIKESLKPGDILEFKYTLFNHFAIFLGIYNNAYILVHFRVVGPSPCIKHDVFIESMKSHKKVRINNMYDHDLKRRIRSADEIRKLALEKLVDHKAYNIITYNCKDFVKDLKYY
uniref:LRAT domain-containing protein n=1 Tax=Strongyloides papillosus TaxID=174720 RepID=A0A0N5C827_STREA